MIGAISGWKLIQSLLFFSSLSRTLHSRSSWLSRRPLSTAIECCFLCEDDEDDDVDEDSDPSDEDKPSFESPSGPEEAAPIPAAADDDEEEEEEEERCLRPMLSMPSGSRMQSSSPASKCDRSPGVDEVEEWIDCVGETVTVVSITVGVDGPLDVPVGSGVDDLGVDIDDDDDDDDDPACPGVAAGNLLFVITFSACIGSVMVNLNLLLMIKFIPLSDFLFVPVIVAFIDQVVVVVLLLLLLLFLELLLLLL